jgi:predicted transcriptional regulator
MTEGCVSASNLLNNVGAFCGGLPPRRRVKEFQRSTLLQEHQMTQATDKLALVADIASSYLRRNSTSVEQIPNVIASITRAMDQAARELEGGAPVEGEPAGASAEAKPTPAVPIKKSVQRDYIVCLEDGVKARTLKRHLQSAHGLSPQQYREKWGLPRDYPMVAPTYSEHRSEMAKRLGLGRKPAEEGGEGEGGGRRGRRQGGTR